MVVSQRNDTLFYVVHITVPLLGNFVKSVDEKTCKFLSAGKNNPFKPDGLKGDICIVRLLQRKLDPLEQFRAGNDFSGSIFESQFDPGISDFLGKRNFCGTFR